MLATDHGQALERNHRLRDLDLEVVEGATRMKNVIAFLLNLVGGSKVWMFAGAAAIAVLVYVGWLRWSIDNLEARNAVLASERDRAVEVANSNARALEGERADNQWAAKLVADSHKKALVAAERRRVIQKEIVRVPAEENCAIGPAAQSAIERVWGIGATDESGAR